MKSLHAKGLLFDCDGTLVHSLISVEKAWGGWAKSVGLLDFSMDRYHGLQRPDIVTSALPEASPEEVTRHAEAVRLAEVTNVEDVVAQPGALDLLNSLPVDTWAIVTSADSETAVARLNQAGLALPKVLISADDLDAGKPHPQGYLLASQRLGIEPHDCIVFEDAPAGLEAAQRAGMRSVAFRTTVDNDHELDLAEVIADSPRNISVQVVGDRLTVTVSV